MEKITHFSQKKLAQSKNTLFLSPNRLTNNHIKMNKVELINAIAEKSGMTKVDARKAVDAMIDAAKEELMKGGKISLVGFGTMGVTERPAHQGRNPRTGKSINIAAKKVVKFKPANNLLK